MKKRQLAKLGLTLGLVAAVGVGGTMALLSAQSNPVTNTFAAGNGIDAAKDITLFEHDPYRGEAGYKDDSKNVFNDGTSTGTENWIDVNGVNYKDLEPNMVLAKDPTVQISKGTADCYLFAKVTNGLKNVTGVSIDGIFSNTSAHWKKLEGTEDVWYYVDSIEAVKGKVINTDNEAFISDELFENITLTSEADIYNTDGTNKLDEKNNIDVKAFVVQATENNNWEAAKAMAKDNDNWK